MQELPKSFVIAGFMGLMACSFADDLDQQLANKKQAAGSQSTTSTLQTITTSSATATATNQTSTATSGDVGTGAQSDSSQSIETSDASSTSTTLSLCPDGDSAKLQIPDSIKDCMDAGRIWHFESQQCTAMRKASFDCNFDTFTQKLRDIGITPGSRLEQAKRGISGKVIKIVGCGESASRDTLLMQWIIAPLEPSSNCVSSPRFIIYTGCYGKDSMPADGAHDEIKNIVLNCMNGIKAP